MDIHSVDRSRIERRSSLLDMRTAFHFASSMPSRITWWLALRFLDTTHKCKRNTYAYFSSGEIWARGYCDVLVRGWKEDA